MTTPAQIDDGHTVTCELQSDEKFSFRRPRGGDISKLFGALNAKQTKNDAGDIVFDINPDTNTQASQDFIAQHLTAWWRSEAITPTAIYDLDYTVFRGVFSTILQSHFDDTDEVAEKN